MYSLARTLKSHVLVQMVIGCAIYENRSENYESSEGSVESAHLNSTI